jgi:hypothetical protein
VPDGPTARSVNIAIPIAPATIAATTGIRTAAKPAAFFVFSD